MLVKIKKKVGFTKERDTKIRERSSETASYPQHAKVGVRMVEREDGRHV